MSISRRAISGEGARMSNGKPWLRLPVVALGAEHLVMGNLMRRNILAYKAPPGNEGYDPICIHPDPRHECRRNKLSQVRIQVKSRYATDAGYGFPLTTKSLDAFDFLVAVFMNIGKYARKSDGEDGAKPPEFFTFPPDVIRRLHLPHPTWSKVRFSGLHDEFDPYRNESGFELIAEALGIERPTKNRSL